MLSYLYLALMKPWLLGISEEHAAREVFRGLICRDERPLFGSLA